MTAALPAEQRPTNHFGRNRHIFVDRAANVYDPRHAPVRAGSDCRNSSLVFATPPKYASHFKSDREPELLQASGTGRIAMRSTVKRNGVRLALVFAGAIVGFTPPARAQDWIRQFGTPSEDTPHSLAPDGAAGVFLGGRTTGSLGGPHAGDFDAFLTRFDGSGNQLHGLSSIAPVELVDRVAQQGVRGGAGIFRSPRVIEGFVQEPLRLVGEHAGAQPVPQDLRTRGAADCVSRDGGSRSNSSFARRKWRCGS